MKSPAATNGTPALDWVEPCAELLNLMQANQVCSRLRTVMQMHVPAIHAPTAHFDGKSLDDAIIEQEVMTVMGSDREPTKHRQALTRNAPAGASSVIRRVRCIGTRGVHVQRIAQVVRLVRAEVDFLEDYYVGVGIAQPVEPEGTSRRPVERPVLEIERE